MEQGRKVMTEKNYVVNVKTSKGTIVTARGDSAEELMNNIEALIKQGAGDVIAVLEQVLTGTPPVSPSNSAIDTVVASLGGTVVSDTPTTGFAPVPPPASAAPTSAGQVSCSHGPMIGRKGNGAKGEWKGYFCPTPKGTPDQCQPQWLTKKDVAWNSI
jgi:predicted RNase H-like HicB family nuclease